MPVFHITIFVLPNHTVMGQNRFQLKYKFALELNQLVTISNLFPLEDVPYCHIAIVVKYDCAIRE